MVASIVPSNADSIIHSRRIRPIRNKCDNVRDVVNTYLLQEVLPGGDCKLLVDHRDMSVHVVRSDAT